MGPFKFRFTDMSHKINYVFMHIVSVQSVIIIDNYLASFDYGGCPALSHFGIASSTDTAETRGHGEAGTAHAAEKAG
jgi:hypothetical protein